MSNYGTSLDKLSGETADIHGRRINILRKLGEGGFAYVYLAKVKASSSSFVSHHHYSDDNNNGYISSDGGASPGSGGGGRRGRSMSLGRRMLRSLSRGRRVGGEHYEYSEDEEEDLSSSNRRSSGGRRRRRRRDGGRRGNDVRSGYEKEDNVQEYVVVKTCSTATSERRAQAENEIRFLRMLVGHPNIVELIDSSFDHMKCFMVLEHCEGGSLLDVILQARSDGGLNDQYCNNLQYLPIFDVLEYFSQLCESVHFLHTFHDDSETMITSAESVNISINTEALYGGDSVPTKKNLVRHHSRSSPYKASSIFRRVGQHYRNPVVHRDLKPENVLLKEDKRMPTGYRCQLCDFGSAIEGRVDLRSAEDRRIQGEIIRGSTTQMYRAPEMVDLHLVPELTERTDVWSLGCCLYMLCFLRNCFEENSNLAILAGSYTIPEQHPFPPEIVELISRMLCMDSNKRASIDEVLQCLDAIKNNESLPPRVCNKGGQNRQLAKEHTRKSSSNKSSRKVYTLDSFRIEKHSSTSGRLNQGERSSRTNTLTYPSESSGNRQTISIGKAIDFSPDAEQEGWTSESRSRHKRLDPKSAAAKRLQSSTIHPSSRLISPNQIPVTLASVQSNGYFEEISDGYLQTNPVQSSRKSSPPALTGSQQSKTISNLPAKTRTIATDENSDRAKLRNGSQLITTRMTATNGDNDWAKFPESNTTVNVKDSRKRRSPRNSNKDIYGSENDSVSDWGFKAFEVDYCAEMAQARKFCQDKGNELSDPFCSEGPQDFSSARFPPGHWSTSGSQSNSLDYGFDEHFVSSNFERGDVPSTIGDDRSSRLFEKLRIGGVAKAFLTNAKFAITSCNTRDVSM